MHNKFIEHLEKVQRELNLPNGYFIVPKSVRSKLGFDVIHDHASQIIVVDDNLLPEEFRDGIYFLPYDPNKPITVSFKD